MLNPAGMGPMFALLLGCLFSSGLSYVYIIVIYIYTRIYICIILFCRFAIKLINYNCPFQTVTPMTSPIPGADELLELARPALASALDPWGHDWSI